MNTTSTNDSPTNRSALSQNIFSRLTTPFIGKSRSFADFDIHLDEPLREYRAGDAVKGSIQLAVPRPLRITHLVLSLHGYAKVYKTAAAPGEGLPSEVKTPIAGRGKTGVQYLGNGLVSLFEDEVILCGGGKLSIGKYSFRFEAQFPARSLPSSLSFERGTISYCLVATLTRPTTMVPAMSREKIIPFRETLDVAFEPKPKARRLHLKALNRSRSRNRSLTGRTMSSTSRTNQSSAESSEQPADDRSQDGSASEISHETGIDSIILQQVQTPSKVSLSIEIPTTSPTQSISGTISASVDVLRGGFLPGDYVPVRISVKHTRSIKSMQGVIVTFYRKAKIDAYPVIAEGKSPAFEDPVPKSRTGLKGLSLTNRGSHMYRMDLAQAFAPLIINPLTMEADVKTAVKIPEECFPTVTSVPGQMIVFTYHIEVIMDLGGKLSSQDRLFAGMNMTKKAPDYSVGAKISGSEHGLPSSMEIYHLIDTSEIRREKGVAQETIQVLIGSHDSKRKPGDIKKVDLWLQDDSASNLSNADELPLESQFQDTARSPEYMATPNEISDQLSDTSYPPQFIPSGFQEPTDEKSRLQLAEQRLLPSAPPDSENFPSSSSAPLFAVPSAPPISDLDSYYPANHITGAPNFHDLGLHEEDDIAPAYQQEISLSSGTITQASPLHLGACGSAATEDKAELERRRLLAMASSPDDDGDEEDDEEDGEKVDFQAAGIPFAPILDAGDTIPHHIQDLGPTLPGYAPKN